MRRHKLGCTLSGASPESKSYELSPDTTRPSLAHHTRLQPPDQARVMASKSSVSEKGSAAHADSCWPTMTGAAGFGDVVRREA
jgi:hypothetical protein